MTRDVGDGVGGSYPRPVLTSNQVLPGLTAARGTSLYWGMTVQSGALVAAVAMLVAAPARAQISSGYDYEARYGKPVDVSITDLVFSPDSYQDRAVRTRGRLELGPSGFRSYLLQDSLMASLQIFPMGEVAPNFESQAPSMMGQEVQVTGVFQVNPQEAGLSGSRPAGRIQFWGYVGPPEPDTKGPIKALSLSLEALVTGAGRRDSQTLRVVGQFRGRNLFGDLPVRSQRESADWVIKDDLFAVWVTGRKPKGDGWQLDPKLKRDTGKWIEVVGRPETQGGVTYLRALRVSLTSAPSATAKALPPPPPPEKPVLPPVVVFALPLDGDAEVAPDSPFRVQFSKDMDQASFAGRVLLRYVGPTRPGDRAFDSLRLSYDEGRRALTVDPGDLLRPGRDVELLLLPGIVDVEGRTLVTRPGQSAGEAVDILRYRVGL